MHSKQPNANTKTNAQTKGTPTFESIESENEECKNTKQKPIPLEKDAKRIPISQHDGVINKRKRSSATHSSEPSKEKVLNFFGHNEATESMSSSRGKSAIDHLEGDTTDQDRGCKKCTIL